MPHPREPRLRLIGPPALFVDDIAVPLAGERRDQLLVLLALHDGEWVQRDRIAALLWPDHPAAEARRNLRKVLFRAHELAGTSGVEASEHAMRWPIVSDLLDFRRALREGRSADAAAASGASLCDGFEAACSDSLAEWLRSERASLAAQWQRAGAETLAALDRPAERAALARRMLAVEPLDETAVEGLVRAELAQGRLAAARSAYLGYAERLAEALGIEPSNALRSLLPAPGDASAPVAAGLAPTEADAFVGRRGELVELASLLASPECRVLTVIGPGGIGKSRLAREALPRLAEGFVDGAWWIDLQDLGSSAEAIARLAQRIGVDINDAGDPLAPVLAWLARRHVLLVFDNAEHLPELHGVIDRIVAASARSRLLVTSRARTLADGETFLPLAGLERPDDESRDLEAAAPFDAVRLFASRARVAQRGFDLAAHLGSVIAIVDAVEGMPLAIELAANWVRLLPPGEIARELRGSIDLLQRDPAVRAQPARPEHRSMRAVLEQSWKLLTPREREALAALSVFHGGFTRDAAQRVAMVPLPLLSALADKSLIGADGNGRFGMHPLVAAYSAQALGEDATRAAEIRGRHNEYFALHLASLAPHAIGDQRLLVAGVTAEYANCRAAWQDAVEQQRADRVYAMTRALWSFFEVQGRYVEGIELMSPALGLSEEHPAAPRALTRLRHGISMLHHRKGDAQEALSLAMSGIGPGEHCGDTEAFVGCLLNTGMCLWDGGRHDEARAHHERGLQVANERRDRHCIVWAMGNLGVVLDSQGHDDQAEALLTQALAGARELGDRYNTAVNLNNLGGLLRDRQRWPAAQVLFEEGLEHCRTYGLVSIGQYLELNLSRLLYGRGKMEQARRHLEAVLARSRESGLLLVEWPSELLLARIDIGEANWPAARHRLKRVVALRRGQASPGELANVVEIYGDLLAAQGDDRGAVAVWRTTLNRGALSAAKQKALADKLATLQAAAGLVDSAAASLSFEDLLARIEQPS